MLTCFEEVLVYRHRALKVMRSAWLRALVCRSVSPDESLLPVGVPLWYVSKLRMLLSQVHHENQEK